MSRTYITVPMDPKLRKRIEAAAEADGRPLASWIRITIVRVLDRQEAAS